MIQINDDYYEDLTPESTITLLKALQASAEATGAAGGTAGIGGESTIGMGSTKGDERGHGRTNVEENSGRQYRAKGVQLPSPGPMSGRKTCENSRGLTSLTDEEAMMGWREKFRSDGALDQKPEAQTAA